MRFPVRLLLVCAFLSPLAASAHDLGHSQLHLRLHGEGAQQLEGSGTWRIPLRALAAVLGLDHDGDGRVTAAELEPHRAALSEYLLGCLELRTDRGTCELRPAQDEPVGDALRFSFFVRCEGPAPLSVRYDLFLDHDPNHQGWIQVSEGQSSQSAVFLSDQRVHRFHLSRPSYLGTFTDYLVQGVWHIWIGLDHLLFLFTLLLPAVLPWREGRVMDAPSLRGALFDILRIVTAFTLAHSLTLVLAALQWVRLDSQLVESAIAASVVIAALNNIWPVVTRRHWALAFLFGLVHGFGFASVLLDLGLPTRLLALSLLSFNVGVELGQLAVVCGVLPVLFILAKNLRTPRWLLQWGSALIALVAAVWLTERVADASLGQLWARAQHPGAPAELEALLDRGQQRQQVGALQEAEQAFRSALPLADVLGRSAAAGWIRIHLGEIALARADLGSAAEQYRAAEAAFTEGQDQAGQAESVRHLAQVAQLAGDAVAAARHYRHAIELGEILRREADVAGDCLALAEVLRTTRQYAAGATMLTRAVELYDRLGRTGALADAQAKLGVVLQLKGDLIPATVAYQGAIRLDEALGRRDRLANHHANLGNVLRKQGHLEVARDHLERSVVLYQSLGAAVRVERARALLGELDSVRLRGSSK